MFNKGEIVVESEREREQDNVRYYWGRALKFRIVKFENMDGTNKMIVKSKKKDDSFFITRLLKLLFILTHKSLDCYRQLVNEIQEVFFMYIHTTDLFINIYKNKKYNFRV